MTQIKTFRAFTAFGLIMTLANCGGGAAGTAAGSYVGLDSTAAVQSPLSGAVLEIDGAAATLSNATVSGTLQHNTGATTLRIGAASIADPDGPDMTGRLAATTGSVETQGVQEFGRSFAYAQVISYATTDPARRVSGTGVIGVATRAADVPASGTATFTGGAQGSFASTARGFDLTNGTSTVTANFAAKTVDVALSNFTATNQASGAAGTAPFTQIDAKGMALSGSSFSGGTITFVNGATPADVSLANAMGETTGQLFGPTAEAGGVIRYTADQTVFSATFLAAK